MKKRLLGYLWAVGVGIIAAGLPSSLQATPISGTINFNGAAFLSGDLSTVLNPSANLSIVGISDVTINPGSLGGVYSGVTANSSGVSFAAFSLRPPPSSNPSPLWTFTGTDGLNYSFDATTVDVNMSSTTANNPVILISGTGLAHVTGYTPTPGIWSIQLGPNYDGVEFSFGASTAVSAVPDGGTTVLMLGAGFLALALLRRKLA